MKKAAFAISLGIAAITGAAPAAAQEGRDAKSPATCDSASNPAIFLNCNNTVEFPTSNTPTSSPVASYDPNSADYYLYNGGISGHQFPENGFAKQIFNPNSRAEDIVRLTGGATGTVGGVAAKALMLPVGLFSRKTAENVVSTARSTGSRFGHRLAKNAMTP